MNSRIAVIDAPSNLGLRPPAPGRVPGVYRLPQALRAAGLAQRLVAVDAGAVAVPPYSPEIDAETGVRNVEAIRRFSLDLSAKIQAVRQEGFFPLVLGGDCSILLGSLLALKRFGRYGLFFVDGHTDFLVPAISQTGGAAGMDLALATGRGPAALANLGGQWPLVRDEDVVVFGFRDAEYREHYPARAIFATPMWLYDLRTVQRLGPARAAEAGITALRTNAIEGFWIHLDADVLDSAVMPAVDSPQPGGLTYAELVDALRSLLASGLAAGLEVTIFDPDLDPDGHLAARLVEALVSAFDGRLA